MIGIYILLSLLTAAMIALVVMAAVLLSRTGKVLDGVRVVDAKLADLIASADIAEGRLDYIASKALDLGVLTRKRMEKVKDLFAGVDKKLDGIARLASIRAAALSDPGYIEREQEYADLVARAKADLGIDLHLGADMEVDAHG